MLCHLLVICATHSTRESPHLKHSKGDRTRSSRPTWIGWRINSVLVCIVHGIVPKQCWRLAYFLVHVAWAVFVNATSLELSDRCRTNRVTTKKGGKNIALCVHPEAIDCSFPLRVYWLFRILQGTWECGVTVFNGNGHRLLSFAPELPHVSP